MTDVPSLAPLLLVITGKPATGKTTLGRRLAADLGLPFFSKDEMKETLFDSLGAADRAWSRRLGIASFALLRTVTAALLGAGQSLAVEANFLAAYDAPFYQSLVARSGARVAQVWLTATPEMIVERFERRAASEERHPGHVELANMAEFRVALLTREDAPLPLTGALFRVETSDFDRVDYIALLDGVRQAIGGAEAPGESS